MIQIGTNGWAKISYVVYDVEYHISDVQSVVKIATREDYLTYTSEYILEILIKDEVKESEEM